MLQHVKISNVIASRWLFDARGGYGAEGTIWKQIRNILLKVKKISSMFHG